MSQKRYSNAKLIHSVRPKSSSRPHLSNPSLHSELRSKPKESRKIKNTSMVTGLSAVSLFQQRTEQIKEILGHVESRVRQLWDCLESVHNIFQLPPFYDTQLLQHTEYLADASNQILQLLASYSKQVLSGEERLNSEPNDTVRLSNVLAQYHSTQGQREKASSRSTLELVPPQPIKLGDAGTNQVISIIGYDPTPLHSSAKQKHIPPPIKTTLTPPDAVAETSLTNDAWTLSNSKKKRLEPLSLDLSPPHKKTPIEDVVTRKTNHRWNNSVVNPEPSEFNKARRNPPLFNWTLEESDTTESSHSQFKLPLRFVRHKNAVKVQDIGNEVGLERTRESREERPEIVIIDDSAGKLD